MLRKSIKKNKDIKKRKTFLALCYQNRGSGKNEKRGCCLKKID